MAHISEPDALFKTFYQVLPTASADLLKTDYLHTYPIFEDHLTSILQYCLIMQNDAPDTVDMTEELYNKLKKTKLLQSYAAIAESLKIQRSYPDKDQPCIAAFYSGHPEEYYVHV